MRTLFLRNLKVLVSCFMLMIGMFQLQVVTAQTNLLNPSTQLQFVNPLPIPPVIDGRNGGMFTISISQFYQDLGLRNPGTGQPMLTRVWGYNGTYPGPTIVASKNVPSCIMGTTRKLLLFETEDEYDRTKPMLGTVDGGAMDFEDPVTENIKLNDTEVWEFYNTTIDAHPIHLHLVKFQVISRQKFNGTLDKQTGKLSNIRLIGQPQVNNLDQDGWKDTEVMLPGEETRVIAKFDLPGRYEWHCHILSHEDHDMMRPFVVSDESITKVQQNVSLEKSIVKDNLNVYPNPFTINTTIKYRF